MKKHISLFYLTVMMITVFSVKVPYSGQINSPKTRFFEGIEADTTETTLPVQETLDSATNALTSLYNELKSKSLFYYFSFNQELLNDFTVSPEELNERVAVYNKAFPGITIDLTQVRMEIIVEKYLTESENIEPTAFEIETVCNDFIARYPLASKPNQKTIYLLARSIALFSMNSVVALQNETSAARMNAGLNNLAKFMEPWPLDDISIDADPYCCLATDTNNGECLVTVAEFNVYAIIKSILHTTRLDSARNILLRDLLSKQYFANLSKKNGVKLQSIDIEEEMESWGEALLRERNGFKRFYDEQALQHAYDKYYNRFFCNRWIKKVGIIGSTDSLYIDSLYTNLIKTEMKNSNMEVSRKNTRLNLLPWVVTSSGELPDTIVSLIDSLRSQQYKKLKTPFGYFLVRIIENKRHHSLLLAEVREKLIYLINEDLARSGGKPDSTCALDYYKINVDKFKAPDTIQVRAWLVPLHNSSTFNTMDSNEQQQKISKDTSTFLPLYISSPSLPALVSDSLLKYVKITSTQKTLIGPVNSTLGAWYFLVDKINAGGKVISFADVKDKIIRELEVKSISIDTLTKTEIDTRMLERERLISAYYSQIPKEIDAVSDDEIKKLIDNGTINVSYENKGSIDKRLLDFARQRICGKILEKDSKNSEKWLEAIAIERPLLFLGCSKYVNNYDTPENRF